MLLNAIYTAVLIIWVAPVMFGDYLMCPAEMIHGHGGDCEKTVEECHEQCVEHNHDAFLQGMWLPVLVLIVALLAPLCTLCVSLPRALFDFVMATCIESHIHKEILHDVRLEPLYLAIGRLTFPSFTNVFLCTGCARSKKEAGSTHFQHHKSCSKNGGGCLAPG